MRDSEISDGLTGELPQTGAEGGDAASDTENGLVLARLAVSLLRLRFHRRTQQ